MTENIFLYLIILLSIFTISMIGVLIYLIHSGNKHKQIMEEITKYSINVSASIDRTIPGILESIIQDCFIDYKIKSMLNELDFINSEKEAEIRKVLAKMVSDRLSPAALDKISLFYKLDSIAAIIADKIYITVMDFVIKHNKDIQQSEIEKPLKEN